MNYPSNKPHRALGDMFGGMLENWQASEHPESARVIAMSLAKLAWAVIPRAVVMELAKIDPDDALNIVD